MLPTTGWKPVEWACKLPGIGRPYARLRRLNNAQGNSRALLQVVRVESLLYGRLLDFHRMAFTLPAGKIGPARGANAWAAPPETPRAAPPKEPKMSSDYTPSSGRRSSRRGGRRPDRQRGGSRSPRQETAAPVPPKKLTLWQKIAAFFGAKPAAPAARTSGYGSVPRDTPARTDRPERKERPERSERSERTERPQRAERPARAERPSGFRTPEIVEVTSPRLYVGNLSFDAAESDLFELFNGVGLVQNVEIVANKHTQKSKGFAFVQMQTVDEAKRAVAELHDKEYMGRKLVVSGAKAVEEKRSERRQAEAQNEAQSEQQSQGEPAQQPEEQSEAAQQPEAQQQSRPE